LVATSLAPTTLRRVIESCGAGSPDLPTSSLDSMQPKLWVIESKTVRLPADKHEESSKHGR
jgi:hypothetical protein